MTRSPKSGSSLVEIQTSSLATRARDAILSAILHDEFDDRLPSEGQLAESLNVSRTTIRSAAQDLERDGVITRTRSVGAIINQHVGHETLALGRRVAFDWLLEAKGHKVSVEVAFRPQAPADRPFELPWDPSIECCVIETDYVADGQLAITTRDFVPWTTIKADGLPNRRVTSLVEFTRRYCRDPIAHTLGRLVPMVNTAGITQLDLASGTPFLRVHERHYSIRGDCVAWSQLDFDDSVLRLKVFRSR